MRINPWEPYKSPRSMLHKTIDMSVTCYTYIYAIHTTGPPQLFPGVFRSWVIEDPRDIRLRRCTRVCVWASGLCSQNPHGFWWRLPLPLAPSLWRPASGSGHFPPTSPSLLGPLWNLQIPTMHCYKHIPHCFRGLVSTFSVFPVFICNVMILLSI